VEPPLLWHRIAYLGGADLWGAELGVANLTDTKNLIQAQIDQACVDEKTKLPTGFKKPEKFLSLKECREKLRKIR
jgi:hypothetical protein